MSPANPSRSPLATIVHLDADAFFVSCELARRPELRGKRCAVGGGPQRGIIASASYEARAVGVYTPMPTARALRVCPDLVLLSHHGEHYRAVSRAMFDLCEAVTPLVQRNSIDEGYLDLGPCGCASVEEVESRVRGLVARIWQELRIPVSIGIGTSLLVSQIASKLRKPRGFVTVPVGEEGAFLAPLPIEQLPGVGKKTAAAIKAREGGSSGLGLRTIGDILQKNDSGLSGIFGRDWRQVAAWAHGIDTRSVETERPEAKSYSQQETFLEDRGFGDFEEIERGLKRMLAELLVKLRADRKRARTLTVKVRYPDFTNRSHAQSLSEPSDLEAPFYPLLGPLLRAAWMRRRQSLRLVSVRLSGLAEGPAQLDLFSHAHEAKRRHLAAVVDRLNANGEKPLVLHASQLGDE